VSRVGVIVKEEKSSVLNEMPHFWARALSQCENWVLVFSFSCVVVIEFAFGIVERGMTGNEPSLYNI